MEEILENQEVRIITRYISAWMWHLMAIIFLCTSIILLVSQKYPFAWGIIGVFTVCEFMAWKRKKEVEGF